MKYEEKNYLLKFQYSLKFTGVLAGLFFLASGASAQVVLPQQESDCLSCHTATPASLANLIVNELDTCDYTNAALFSGWGWNAAVGQSCPPLDSATAVGAYAHDNSAVVAEASAAASDCDYSNAASFDGWGWNPVAMESCPPTDTSSSDYGTVEVASPVLDCVDSDGDGYGWDGVSSCVVGAVTPVVSTPTESSSPDALVCIDSDNDGWGWNGVGSCRVDAVEPIVSDDPQSSDPVALTCTDSDGDGYGWNGVESCSIGGSDPVSTDPESIVGDCGALAGTTRTSATGPVRSTGNSFYPDNGPQCVTPDNQFNGPGLGFGDFLLGNNAWNGDKSTAEWTQCISLSANSSGSVAPSWSYDWGNEDDLQPGYMEWEVKSYPEILYGAKSNTEVSAPCTTTGLPIQYSQMPDIDISFSYRSTQTNNRVGDLGDENNNPVSVTGGDRNIAIESFLHSSCDIQRGADSNREFELMVWLDHGAERLPSGSPPIATYTDSYSRVYDVYVKGQADSGYIAYVAQNAVTSGTLDWDEFFNDAKSNATTYGVKAIDESWCLANILFGSEIWWGEGDFTLDYYQITQSY